MPVIMSQGRGIASHLRTIISWHFINAHINIVTWD